MEENDVQKWFEYLKIFQAVLPSAGATPASDLTAFAKQGVTSIVAGQPGPLLPDVVHQEAFVRSVAAKIPLGGVDAGDVTSAKSFGDLVDHVFSNQKSCILYVFWQLSGIPSAPLSSFGGQLLTTYFATNISQANLVTELLKSYPAGCLTDKMLGDLKAGFSKPGFTVRDGVDAVSLAYQA